jgi:pimeloyl-ACP methyl ester carboxylesterase
MELYFEDTGGHRPALLLIAGLASDDISWTFQKGAFAEHHRLLTFDNRGVGRSPKPPGPYSIEQMAQDALSVLDAAGVARASILGHSMGGAIAQHLAIEHPDRVDRLILACTFSRFGGRALAVVEGWAGILGLTSSAEVIGNALFPWLYSDAFLSAPGTLEACRLALANHPYPMEAAPVAAQVAALKGFDSTERLAAITPPTLVLGAEHDLLATPAHCRDLATAIPQARLRILPGTGHSCMLETPELFNAAVLEFLASV